MDNPQRNILINCIILYIKRRNNTISAQRLSEEQERQIVREYINGVAVQSLVEKYGFKTKKSITDKVKKYYPDSYKDLIEQAHNNRKEYNYTLEKITSEFDAYYIGLLLTDGYISTRNTDVGIDLADEDCIKFLSKSIGKEYKKYENYKSRRELLPRYRLLISGVKLIKNLKRFGIVQNKSLTLQPPKLLPEEEKFIPYIIRGIIDGDGCVSPTSYGSAQFYICTMSKDFAEWLVYILENKMYMINIHIRKNNYGLWRIESAYQPNIYKLISMSYNKPFGMMRKYNLLRQTFRDYNGISLLEEFAEDKIYKEKGIVQTTTDNTDLGN